MLLYSAYKLINSAKKTIQAKNIYLFILLAWVDPSGTRVIYYPDNFFLPETTRVSELEKSPRNGAYAMQHLVFVQLIQ